MRVREIQTSGKLTERRAIQVVGQAAASPNSRKGHVRSQRAAWTESLKSLVSCLQTSSDSASPVRQHSHDSDKSAGKAQQSYCHVQDHLTPDLTVIPGALGVKHARCRNFFSPVENSQKFRAEDKLGKHEYSTSLAK